MTASRSEANEAIYNNLTKLIANIFELIPDQKKMGITCGQVLPKAKFKFAYKNYNEILLDHVNYSENVACVLYNIHVIIKDKKIFEDSSAGSWQTKLELRKYFRSLDKIFYGVTEVEGVPTFEPLEILKVLPTQLVVSKPQSNLKIQLDKEKIIVTFDLLVNTKQKKFSFTLTPGYSWVHHIVDERTYKLAVLMQEFAAENSPLINDNVRSLKDFSAQLLLLKHISSTRIAHYLLLKKKEQVSPSSTAQISLVVGKPDMTMKESIEVKPEQKSFCSEGSPKDNLENTRCAEDSRMPKLL